VILRWYEGALYGVSRMKNLSSELVDCNQDETEACCPRRLRTDWKAKTPAPETNFSLSHEHAGCNSQ